MNNTKNMIFARNEIENKVDELQIGLGLTEDEMLFVVEGVLSTARHKALVREVYTQAQEEVEKAKAESEAEAEMKKKESED